MQDLAKIELANPTYPEAQIGFFANNMVKDLHHAEAHHTTVQRKDGELIIKEKGVGVALHPEG
jgi:hypothetical protein